MPSKKNSRAWKADGDDRERAGGEKSGADRSGSGRKADDENGKPTAEETRWEKISSNLKTIGGAVLLAIFIRTVLFEAFEIEGPSMEPTLLNGDRVVVSKYLYGLFLPFHREATLSWGDPEPGDVVIIKSPADNVDIVKRVIALPGDTVAVRNDRIIINDEPLKAVDVGPCNAGSGRTMAPRCRVIETRVGDVEFRTSGIPMAQTRAPVTVPPGHFFVLGDHRDSSNDSRSIGMIPFDRLKGKSLAIYWSSGEDGLRWERIFTSVY
jgi:signal peptidase I